MPLFEIRPGELVAATKTSFEAAGMKEPHVIQRLLHAQIACLGDGLMVLNDTFGDGQDSQPRIDLLCLDTNANLMVVELKCDDDGARPRAVETQAQMAVRISF